jgi:hypothetical protein
MPLLFLLMVYLALQRVPCFVMFQKLLICVLMFSICEMCCVMMIDVQKGERPTTVVVTFARLSCPRGDDCACRYEC